MDPRSRISVEWDHFVVQDLMSFGTVGRGLKHRKGLKSIGMSVPVSIPHPYQSGNMETLKAMLSG